MWCSGADVTTVLRCESSEQNKYINVGMVVFFVSLLASLSATFFVSYAFDRSVDPGIHWSYALVGLVWGLVIISLDRSIVATINKEDPLKTQLINASPRFVIAIFIGLVISTPLEMKIFSKEINDKLKEIIYKEIGSGSNQLLTSRKELLKAKESELATLSREKDFNYTTFRSEINGGTTGWIGYGPKSKQYEARFDESVKSYNAKKIEVDSAREQVKKLQDQVGTVESITDNQIAKRAGVEKRVKALYSLSGFHWIITLLFILFEILPMVVKLMSSKGNYEKFARDQKTLFELKVIDEFNDEQGRKKELQIIQRQKENKQIEMKNTIETELKEVILKKLANTQKEMAEGRIDHFKKRSLDKLHDMNHPDHSTTNLPDASTSTLPVKDIITPNNETQPLDLEIALNSRSAFIRDNAVEEIIWKGNFEGVLSKFVFHSDELNSQKKMSIKKGVKLLNDTTWQYQEGELGKIELRRNGSTKVYQYNVTGNKLKLLNKKKILEFEC